MKQWIVVLLILFVPATMEGVSAQERPTFYPNRSVQDALRTRPVQEQDVQAGRDILAAGPGISHEQGYRYEPYQEDYSGLGFSPMALTGDPITMIPHAIDLANRYGIVQCVAVLLVMFIFQYVRNTQKNASQREEFFRNQLNYSDQRTTEELTRLSSKLGMMEQDFRALQDRFDRHAELIRTNGQLCREIVSTMTAHNLAVEQGLAEIAAKVDALAAKVKRKIKGMEREDRA